MARIFVDPQPTPNPNALKFNVSVPLTEGGSKSFSSKEAAAGHPLAARLFEIDGVAGLFMLGNFVTVTKRPDASWDGLVPKVIEAIEAGGW